MRRPGRAAAWARRDASTRVATALLPLEALADTAAHNRRRLDARRVRDVLTPDGDHLVPAVAGLEAVGLGGIVAGRAARGARRVRGAERVHVRRAGLHRADAALRRVHVVLRARAVVAGRLRRV